MRAIATASLAALLTFAGWGTPANAGLADLDPSRVVVLGTGCCMPRQ